MDERNAAELFNDSLERCQRRPDFLDRFYEIFLGSSEVVASKFAHTDFVKQTRMVKVSLYMLMALGSSPPEADTHLERIAELHSKRQLDIGPELYDLWLECLLRAVSEFDPKFNKDVDQA